MGVHMRYYFNLTDGQTILDNEGDEFPNIEAAKDAAISMSSEMLRGLKYRANFWSGEAWSLRVTDGPGGTGKTLFEVKFSGTLESV
jgi:hypothetical protein